MLHQSVNSTKDWQLPENVLSVSHGDILEDCNFTQHYPDTTIFAGVRNLLFINTNLNNCVLPPSAKIGGNCSSGRYLFKCVDSQGTEVPEDEGTIVGEFISKLEHPKINHNDIVKKLKPYKAQRLKEHKRIPFIKERRNNGGGN